MVTLVPKTSPPAIRYLRYLVHPKPTFTSIITWSEEHGPFPSKRFEKKEILRRRRGEFHGFSRVLLIRDHF